MFLIRYFYKHFRKELFLIGIIYSSLFVSTAYLVSLFIGRPLPLPITSVIAQTTHQKPNATTKASPTPRPIVAQFETVATSSANLLGIGNASWAGEIISNTDLAVYPLREGAITEWKVNIGQTVKAGQVLGKLSAPPVDLESNATLAEKQAELSIARSKLAASQINVQTAKRKLQERIKSITDQRDTDYKLLEREGDEQIRKNEKAKSDAEWSEKVTEADVVSADLDRELTETQGEVRAAEAVYTAVTRGVDNNIYALKGGVISGVFKNIGDYVTPETRIASVGNQISAINDKTVRFSIPSNYATPLKGALVKITRPGYPFTAIPAEITGVGTALNNSGTYVAEAKFNESVDWPVHASVRVINEGQSNSPVFVPIAALWWDDQGTSKVWVVKDKKATATIVKAGRTVGDRVEITSGLSPAIQYIAKAVPEIKEGSTVQEFGEGGAARTKTSGDGHDHEH
ncbi:MAG: hypothetical protein M3Q44_00125 [bacterium]|nr:hypothetical protein [bacterium]